jgi:signal transduction histidine kinase
LNSPATLTTPAAGGESRRWDRLVQVSPFLALIPLAAFGLLLLLGVVADRRADRQDDVLRSATALAAGLDAELRSGMRALDALAGSPRLAAGDLAGFRAEAQRLLAREPQWFTIALTDGERQLLNLRFPEGALLPPVQDLAAVGSVLRSGLPAPGGLVEGRISFRVPVRANGAVRYALVATQEATSFVQLLDLAGLRPGWSALLLDGEGRMIARAAGGGAEPDVLRPALEQRRSLVVVGDLLALALPVGESRWSLLVTAPRYGLAEAGLGWLVAALGASALLAALGLVVRLQRQDRGQAAQLQRRQAEAMARALKQERSRIELMTAVSQELRPPLTTLLAQTERLADADLPRAVRDRVEEQRRAGTVLLALVDDVLDFARLEEGGLVLEDADIEIAVLLDDCAARLRPLAQEKGLALRVAIDPGLPRWLRGDPMRLRQVTRRLVEHAIGGSTAGEVVLAGRLTQRPEHVEIAVTGTGPGLSAEELPRLFEGAAATGGLSLTLCRLLAQAMGGGIAAANLPGRGTRLAFTVPFRPGAAPVVSRSGPALRVLVAEDVAASRMLLTTMLARAGHAVTAVEDGPAALAALHGAGFDLAVLDLQMPGLGGLGVARAVRELPGAMSRVPLIALTADPGEWVEADCRGAGFDAVLRKPFETRRLLGLVDGLRGRVVVSV